MADENEEESFVILGTSPTDLDGPFKSRNYEKSDGSSLSSLTSGKMFAVNGNSDIENNFNTFDSCGSKYSFVNENNQIDADGPNAESVKIWNNSSTKRSDNTNFSTSNNSSDSNIIKMHSFNKLDSNLKNAKPSLENDKQNLSLDGTKNVPAKEGSLAASFLMGDIQLDVLKATLHSQFPSLCSSSIKSEEMAKLQNVLAEYIELKETLQKNNVAMRKHFTTLQKWQDEVKIQKEEQTRQVNEFQETVAKLRNENLELRNELGSKIEQIKINEDLIRKENDEMIKTLSWKTAQIQNMEAQIEKLEQQHLDSFEYIRKLRTDNEEEKENKKVLEHEYVPILEYKRVVNDLEQRLSEAVAKNLELDEMKEKYLDEVKVLKERLSSCQQELKNAQSDINVLKSNDDEKKKHFENYEKERDEMRNEISILKTQVEIYSKDFEMERLARQNLAGEKEKVLTDLRLLQKRNQELLESSKKHLDSLGNDVISTPRRSSPPNSSTRNSRAQIEDQVYETNVFVCPLCNRQFKLLNDLQTHVEDCIDT